MRVLIVGVAVTSVLVQPADAKQLTIETDPEFIELARTGARAKRAYEDFVLRQRDRPPLEVLVDRRPAIELSRVSAAPAQSITRHTAAQPRHVARSFSWRHVVRVTRRLRLMIAHLVWPKHTEPTLRGAIDVAARG